MVTLLPSSTYKNQRLFHQSRWHRRTGIMGHPLPTGGTTTPRALGLPLVVASGTTITPSAPILVVVCSTLLRSIVSLDQEVFARFCKAGTSRTLSNSQIRNKWDMCIVQCQNLVKPQWLCQDITGVIARWLTTYPMMEKMRMRSLKACAMEIAFSWSGLALFWFLDLPSSVLLSGFISNKQSINALINSQFSNHHKGKF